MVNTELQKYQSSCCVSDGEQRCDRSVFIKSCSAWLGRPPCRMHYARVMRHGTTGSVQSRWRAPDRKRDRRGKELAEKLDKWKQEFGTVWRIRKITLASAPVSVKAAWIAQHKRAEGPRQGASCFIHHDNTIRSWQERGWIHLEYVDDNTYEVTWVGGYDQ